MKRNERERSELHSAVVYAHDTYGKTDLRTHHVRVSTAAAAPVPQSVYSHRRAMLFCFPDYLLQKLASTLYIFSHLKNY